MREILFRGKRVDNGEWVQGDFVSSGCGIAYTDYINEHGDIGEVFCKVIPETVGQFTGLTDKNGKKIFEGDIVDCFSSDYVGRPKINTIKVKDMTDYNTMVYLNCSNELEIIGNIQDSPKPFKGGANE